MKPSNPIIVTCATLIATTSLSFANPIDYLYEQLKLKTYAPSNNPIQELIFKQQINHNKPQRGTFSQRYFLDETFAPNAEAPVLFYICGQEACSKEVLSGAIREQAQKRHAKLLAIEHRYYGQSVPVTNFNNDSMRFLTTRQVIADLVNFENQIKLKNNWTGPWIAVGTGYSGAIAAYYRVRFPNMVAGAIASSATVMAKENFVEYDNLVTKTAGSACAQAINTAVQQVETAAEFQSDIDSIKEMFAASDIKESNDFINLMADIAGAAILHGDKEQFCSYLLSTADPLPGYAQFSKELFQKFQITAVSLTAQGALSKRLDDYNQGFGLRQWYYQACTEYGDWENAHPNPELSTRSERINSKYRYKTCKRLFNLRSSANTGYINIAYYQPLLTPAASQIYFTNGELDPLTYLSISSKNKNTTNPKLSYLLIQGGNHGDDMQPSSSTDSKSVQRARMVMQFLTQKWVLRCS